MFPSHDLEGNPLTTSFDCSGGDFLVVGAFTNSSTTNLTATYNGVSMTRLTFGGDASGGNKNAFFYLANPASGSNTLSLTRTGGTNIAYAVGAYSGVDTTSPIDASVFDAGINSTSFTSSSVTVSDADNWAMATFRNTDNPSLSSSQVSLRVRTTVVYEELWDSNGTIGSTGSYSVTYTISPSGRFDGHSLVIVNAAAAAAATDNAIFSFGGF